MNNSLYEDNYSKIVEPKYGNRRDNIKPELDKFLIGE
jgi:hypothetical protein